MHEWSPVTVWENREHWRQHSLSSTRHRCDGLDCLGSYQISHMKTSLFTFIMLLTEGLSTFPFPVYKLQIVSGLKGSEKFLQNNPGGLTKNAIYLVKLKWNFKISKQLYLCVFKLLHFHTFFVSWQLTSTNNLSCKTQIQSTRLWECFKHTLASTWLQFKYS